ncbi:MAG: hypothetical protein WDW38_001101 [Sanguina aurantia]
MPRCALMNAMWLSLAAIVPSSTGDRLAGFLISVAGSGQAVSRACYCHAPVLCVATVKVSARLTDSPSCLALSDYEMAPHLARLLREAGQDMPESKPTLEINPQHALVKRVASEADEARARDLATLLLPSEDTVDLTSLHHSLQISTHGEVSSCVCICSSSEQSSKISHAATLSA